PAMQNLFAVGASPAPSRPPAASSRQIPSSRFEDALEDARPKEVAAEAPQPNLKPAEKSTEAKRTSSGNKPAGNSRSKRQTRRAAHRKGEDSTDTSTENTDLATTADGQTPDSTDAGPEKKTADQAAGAKTGDSQQSPIFAAQAVNTTQASVPVEQPGTKAKVEQEGTNAPRKAAIQPLQADGTKKQATATGQSAPPDAGKAARPDATVAGQADAAVVAQSAAAQSSAPVQGIAPRGANGNTSGTATNDATVAATAVADIDLATSSSDSPTALPEGEGDPAPAAAGDAGGAAHAAARAFSDLLASAQGADAQTAKPDGQSIRTAAAQSPAPAPEAQFAEANHAQIVSGVHGQLLPNGGSMQLRLDPPELGALHITVQMRDGVMSASFATPSDQAARLLTHSLGQLKTALESQGVSVEKLHVEQSPKEPKSNGGEGRQPQDQGTADHPAQQEQQRREMLRRMWRRLSGGQDPLDLVA
ncbi:MAG TPA: flagellar hook-length control protein FliK, partial [Tepidisphaeraceae bacterium]|nr:flagellar hook-length control protein FliK [Tepidisphaeraceae bacterium]